MRLDAAIRDAADRLAAVSESARLDAELLLCQSIDVARSYLFAHPEDELDVLSLERFDALLRRRLDGEPQAYITGRKDFWSHELLVSPATLVPRPETELLVELALRVIPRDGDWNIVDLGTGSGAIALSIAAERPLSRLTATDESKDALAVAAENLRQADIDNVTCIEGDWTMPLDGQQFHVIISNPPYVNDDDPALGVLRHEPRGALAAGADGLDDIRRLANECRKIIVPDGWLMLEHGSEQAEAVAAILGEAGWSGLTVHNDFAGHPRVTVARWNGKQARLLTTQETS